MLHRDITPANVVISRDGTPCLVGFGLATSLAEIRPEFTHYTEIVGTLAYWRRSSREDFGLVRVCLPWLATL